MPTTSYTDPAGGWKAWFLEDRTDTSASSVDDALGEDARLILEAFTAGVLGSDAFQTVEDSPAAMRVVVGSGTAEADVAIIDGDDSGQGKYIVRSQDATTDVTVPASDASPRIDEIYLVIQDDSYDSSGNVVPRIGYRQGDDAADPDAPGPDSAWDAYLLIASILVPAAATEIEDGDITDERVRVRPFNGVSFIGEDSGPSSSQDVDSASVTTINDLSVSHTLPESRRLKFTATVDVRDLDGNGIRGTIQLQGVSGIAAGRFVDTGSGQRSTWVVCGTAVVSAGAKTFGVAITNDNGGTSNTIRLGASGCRLLVEDAGPA